MQVVGGLEKKNQHASENNKINEKEREREREREPRQKIKNPNSPLTNKRLSNQTQAMPRLYAHERVKHEKATRFHGCIFRTPMRTARKIRGMNVVSNDHIV